MVDIYWLQQSEADVPLDDCWLSVAEAERLRTFRFAKRRADWRLGRWTAKRALIAYLNIGACHHLSDLEIRSAASGRPEAFLAKGSLPVEISLSHRGGLAVCVVAPSGTELGCDLESVEPRSAAFVADYFTAEEQALYVGAAPADRSRLVALLWSAKESVLKALDAGLRLDTRYATVRPSVVLPGDSEDWNPLQVHCEDGQIFHGWWRNARDFVCTLVAAPKPALPIVLSTSNMAETLQQ